MAKALLARDQPQFSKTAEFCQMFDRWFDSLNGRQRYGPSQISMPMRVSLMFVLSRWLMISWDG